jgi:hypothetical protein
MKTVTANLLLLTVSILAAAVIAEIALRILLPAPNKWKYPQESYTYDAEVGHWLTPGQKAFTHDKAVRINSAGLRGPEYSTAAPAGVYRILALGDSQTFGNGLDETETWPEQLEALLSQHGELKYEILNAGIPATDTWQHQIILGRMLSRYHPDAVILALYVNDVTKKYTPNPRSHQLTNTVKHRIAYILKQSSLLLTLRSAVDSLRHSIAPQRQFVREGALAAGSGGTGFQESWAQVRESLSTMHTMCTNNGIPFIVVALPRRDHVDGRLPWSNYFNHLETITDQQNITLISTYEALKHVYQQHGDALFIPWDGHNSALANGVIARQIADAIMNPKRAASFAGK